MSVLWVRLDTSLPAHDKIVTLVGDPSPYRWRAAFSYVCSIAWSGSAGTDGRIPRMALPMMHGTPHTADLLITHALWEPDPLGGYRIHNYAERQQTSSVTDAKRRIARRAACIRWHGPGCWDEVTGCKREDT